MMKNIFVSITLGAVLCMMVFSLGACSRSQLGKTSAQIKRDHIRNARLSRQELSEDIDTFLLIDEPSKLTDKRIK